MNNRQPAQSMNIDAMLSSCVSILPYGFAIDLAMNTADWQKAVRKFGQKPLCDAVAAWLSNAYLDQYGEAFLFSESCISYEIRYHLSTYLWTQGSNSLRPLSTLLFSRRRLIRSCRSIEIDTNDVYRWTQRIIFHYYSGIRSQYKRSVRDPYTCNIFGKLIRIPFISRPRI